MKSKFIILSLFVITAICLCYFSGYSRPKIQPEKTLFIAESSSIPKDNPTVIPIFTLVMANCETISTVCCCASGNSRICDLPGLYFVCYFGGSFECDPALGDCEDNPSPVNCSACCTTC